MHNTYIYIYILYIYAIYNTIYIYIYIYISKIFASTSTKNESKSIRSPFWHGGTQPMQMSKETNVIFGMRRLGNRTSSATLCAGKSPKSPRPEGQQPQASTIIAFFVV